MWNLDLEAQFAATFGNRDVSPVQKAPSSSHKCCTGYELAPEAVTNEERQSEVQKIAMAQKTK